MSNYLKYILNEKNITMTKLSELTGINRTTISKICSDTNKYKKGMRIDTAYHISKVLNIPLEDFIKKMCDIDEREYNIKNNKIKYTNKEIIIKIDEILNILNERNNRYENQRN